MFHSYKNLQHLCGECIDNGSVCCDSSNKSDNCEYECGLRLVFSVQPYGSVAMDVNLS